MRGWKLTSNVYLLILGFSFALAQFETQAQSVLQQGTWVKIGITQSGVVRLSQEQLAQLNPAFASADPRRFRLYGNGGAILPQPNATSRPVDLIENAIQVTGETDGRFDATDAVLFFGQSPHVIRYDSTARRFTHEINPYADTTFYFLTIGSQPGLRIAERPAGTLAANPTVTAFDDYQYYEPELVKLPSVRSGRVWFGDYLTNDTTKTVQFEVPGTLANAPVRLTASAVARAVQPTLFRVRVDDKLVGTMPITAVSGYEYDYQGTIRTDTFSVRLAAATNSLRLSLSYQKNGLYAAQGYLNFLAVQVRREMRQYNGTTWMRRLPASQYAVKQATSNLRVWNITNPLLPISQAYFLSSGGDAGWVASARRLFFVY